MMIRFEIYLSILIELLRSYRPMMDWPRTTYFVESLIHRESLKMNETNIFTYQ